MKQHPVIAILLRLVVAAAIWGLVLLAAHGAEWPLTPVQRIYLLLSLVVIVLALWPTLRAIAHRQSPAGGGGADAAGNS